jgi:uncharacterized membrane protein
MPVRAVGPPENVKLHASAMEPIRIIHIRALVVVIAHPLLLIKNIGPCPNRAGAKPSLMYGIDSGRT